MWSCVEDKCNVSGGNTRLKSVRCCCSDILVTHTSSSPAPAIIIRCPFVIPFSMKISWRFFSVIVFSPLHFLQLQLTSTPVRIGRGQHTHQSFSLSFSPTPWQEWHCTLDDPTRDGEIYKITINDRICGTGPKQT